MLYKTTLNWALIIATFFVSCVSIAPHVAFLYSLGREYRGVYMMATANETEYLARTQEVRDGHFQLGSVPIFEYKSSPFVMPPSIYDFIIAYASWLFGVSVVTLTIVSKALLPAMFFVAIYFFITSLAGSTDKNTNLLGIAGGFLIIFGYDLVDFRTVLGYLVGSGSPPGSFLLWTRPMNPVLGGILLFSLLRVLWRLNEENINKLRKAFYILGAALLVAMMIMSYYFSWTLAFSIGGVLGIINIVRKRRFFVRRLLTIYVGGLFLSFSYWINAYRTINSPWYHDMALRVGAFWGHMPIINKFVLAGTLLFFILFFIFRKYDEDREWWWFCSGLLGACWVVFNQQILTGYTIWPFHYVQYTIPLIIMIAFVTIYRSFGLLITRFFSTIIIFIIAVLIIFGVYTQALAYKAHFEEYKILQRYGELFSWVNRNAPNDCSILSMDDFFNSSLPGYTQCNAYLSGFMSQFLIPQDRVIHRYMTILRLRGISSKDIDQYVTNHKDEVIGELYAIGGLVRGSQDPISQKAISRFPYEYRLFLKTPLRTELAKYRIDYILVDGSNQNIVQMLNLQNNQQIYHKNGFTLYAF